MQDCVVLLREDFLKYTCVILPKEITRGHADNLIKRCRHTVLEDERIRPLLFDLLENIATTKLPNGRYEYCDGEYDHSKWMSICSTESVVSFDGEYFSSAKIEFNMRQNVSMEFLENLKQRFDDSDYYHVTRSLTDKIMPKGCHAEITDIFMDDHLL